MNINSKYIINLSQKSKSQIDYFRNEQIELLEQAKHINKSIERVIINRELMPISNNFSNGELVYIPETNQTYVKVDSTWYLMTDSGTKE